MICSEFSGRQVGWYASQVAILCQPTTPNYAIHKRIYVGRNTYLYCHKVYLHFTIEKITKNEYNKKTNNYYKMEDLMKK